MSLVLPLYTESASKMTLFLFFVIHYKTPVIDLEAFSVNDGGS